MIAIIKVIDEQTGRVFENEYKMPPTDIHEFELCTRYDFHFCFNVAKPLFNQKEKIHDRL